MTIDESKRYIRDRITALRMKKGVSEYRMSLDLGRSKGYIQGISSGKSLPSMEEFLCICEYLDVSVNDFFNSDRDDPVSLNRLDGLAKKLSPDELALLTHFARILADRKIPDTDTANPFPVKSA